MQKKKKQFLSVFLVCLFFSFLILFFSKNGLLTMLGIVVVRVFEPFQKNIVFLGHNQESTLKIENRKLVEQLIDQRKLQHENDALHDQFQISSPHSSQLLIATIVGSPSFIPGVTLPETFVIDKGTDDGVAMSQAVVLGSNLVGKIIHVTPSLSLMALISNKMSVFPAKTVQHGTLGISRGMGNGGVLFDNIVLSEHIEKGDIVVTNGDITMDGKGYPPGLIVGKITAVSKNPSALFQTASIASLVSFTNITKVFVLTGDKK